MTAIAADFVAAEAAGSLVGLDAAVLDVFGIFAGVAQIVHACFPFHFIR